jgi:hypothetical protein
VQQRLLAIAKNAPRRQHRLARLAQVQPLGDPIDEQVENVELAEIPAGKGLVLGPQPFRDLAHRRAAQQTPPALVGKQRLDVAHAQAARKGLDGKLFEHLRAPAHHLPQPRPEWLRPIGNLWRAELDRPFRCLQTARPVAVAIASARRRATRIVVAPKRITRLALQGLLDDQPGRQPDQLGPLVRRLRSPFHQRLQLLACPLRCGYPLHQGAPSSEAGRQTEPR